MGRSYNDVTKKVEDREEESVVDANEPSTFEPQTSDGAAASLRLTNEISEKDSAGDEPDEISRRTERSKSISRDDSLVHVPRTSVDSNGIPEPWGLVDPLFKDLSQASRFYLSHCKQTHSLVGRMGG